MPLPIDVDAYPKLKFPRRPTASDMRCCAPAAGWHHERPHRTIGWPEIARNGKLCAKLADRPKRDKPDHCNKAADRGGNLGTSNPCSRASKAVGEVPASQGFCHIRVRCTVNLRLLNR